MQFGYVYWHFMHEISIRDLLLDTQKELNDRFADSVLFPESPILFDSAKWLYCTYIVLKRDNNDGDIRQLNWKEFIRNSNFRKRKHCSFCLGSTCLYILRTCSKSSWIFSWVIFSITSKNFENQSMWRHETHDKTTLIQNRLHVLNVSSMGRMRY